MSKQQTAIEFLIKAFQGAYGEKVINVISVQVEQAKEKEKEHIRSAYMDGQDDLLEHCCCQQEIHFNSLHYYQRTFKK
jgi:hypothetical protein